MSFLSATCHAAPLLFTLACCTAPPAPPVALLPPPLPPPLAILPPPAPAPRAVPPPVDPSADADQLSLASALCQAAIKHADGKVLVGCRSCPPFSDPASHPDGTVAVDPDSFWPIDAVYRGAFTTAGADQRAVVFEGCESHAENYGGTLLVDVAATGYRARSYVSGLHPTSCKPYRRPDGRDLLVCELSDAHQSTGTNTVFAFDFAAGTADDPLKGWTNLVTVRDNGGGACLGVDPGIGVLQGHVLGFRFEDRNGDGVPDLVVDLDHRRTPGSRALDARVQKACNDATAAGGEPSIDALKLFGAPKRETVELLFDGHGWKPTPRSAAVLRGL